MAQDENSIDELSASIAMDWSQILSGSLPHIRLRRELAVERRVLFEEQSRLQQKLAAARSLLLARGNTEVTERLDRLSEENRALEGRILELVQKLGAAESRCDDLLEVLDHRREDLQRTETQLLKVRRELAAASLNSTRLESERARMEHAVTSMMRLQISEGGPPRGTVAQHERRSRSTGFLRGVLVGLLIATAGVAGFLTLERYVDVAQPLSSEMVPPAVASKSDQQ